MKKLIYLLLGLLGFTACDENGGTGGLVCEYGTPTVDFSVKGRVTDTQGNPIKGIVVSSTDTGAALEAVTAADGSFTTNKVKDFSIFGKLVFTDTDGAENGGEFETLTVDLNTLPETKVAEGDGGWYGGEYEVTADVKLKEK